MSEVVSAPVREGDILAAKYRVDSVLGRGGTGIVVAATHLQLEQRVALKFLINASVDEQARARFLREARAVVRLKSEHVVRVLDTGSLDNGLPYIVMELLLGRDLAKELGARGSVSIVEAVDWVLQACEGIAEAHSLGIVHRDLKPANLFRTVRADHSVLIKVLDFGIAKVLDSQRAPDYALTKTATLMGSPHCMSPEQIRNAKSVDQRADIWALGSVLYELLVGSAPFAATTAPALLAQIMAEPPRPLHPLRPDAPRGLEAVINRCLEKEPARRFPGVSEFARELARFGSEDARASSERISRISLGKGLPKLSHQVAALRMGTDPTLIAIEPSPRRRQKTAAPRWALALALGAGAMLGLGALWFLRRERVTPPAPSGSAQSSRAPSAEPAVAVPVVTPVPGPVWADVPARAPSQSVVPVGANASAESVTQRAPTPRALGSASIARASTAELATSPTTEAVPVQRAPDLAPAENPLNDRK